MGREIGRGRSRSGKEVIHNLCVTLNNCTLYPVMFPSLEGSQKSDRGPVPSHPLGSPSGLSIYIYMCDC